MLCQEALYSFESFPKLDGIFRVSFYSLLGPVRAELLTSSTDTVGARN